MRDLVRAFVDADPQRALYGSDWPYTKRTKVRIIEEAIEETSFPEIDDAAWLRSLNSWLGDEEWDLLLMVIDLTILCGW